MQRILIVNLIVIVIAAVFALQNAAPVTVSFLKWRFSVSLALLLIAALCLGAIAGLIASVSTYIKARKELREKERVVKELQDNLVEYRKLIEPSAPVS